MLVDWKSKPLGRESAFSFFKIRPKCILTNHSYSAVFQAVIIFFSFALVVMWHLIMDSPETFPWGLLHQKYLFQEDSSGIFHLDSNSPRLSLPLNPELIQAIPFLWQDKQCFLLFSRKGSTRPVVTGWTFRRQLSFWVKLWTDTCASHFTDFTDCTIAHLHSPQNFCTAGHGKAQPPTLVFLTPQYHFP